jgi:hypothetical protein
MDGKGRKSKLGNYQGNALNEIDTPYTFFLGRDWRFQEGKCDTQWRLLPAKEKS